MLPNFERRPAYSKDEVESACYKLFNSYNDAQRAEVSQFLLSDIALNDGLFFLICEQIKAGTTVSMCATNCILYYLSTEYHDRLIQYTLKSLKEIEPLGLIAILAALLLHLIELEDEDEQAFVANLPTEDKEIICKSATYSHSSNLTDDVQRIITFCVEHKDELVHFRALELCCLVVSHSYKFSDNAYACYMHIVKCLKDKTAKVRRIATQTLGRLLIKSWHMGDKETVCDMHEIVNCLVERISDTSYSIRAYAVHYLTRYLVSLYINGDEELNVVIEHAQEGLLRGLEIDVLNCGATVLHDVCSSCMSLFDSPLFHNQSNILVLAPFFHDSLIKSVLAIETVRSHLSDKPSRFLKAVAPFLDKKQFRMLSKIVQKERDVRSLLDEETMSVPLSRQMKRALKPLLNMKGIPSLKTMASTAYSYMLTKSVNRNDYLSFLIEAVRLSNRTTFSSNLDELATDVRCLAEEADIRTISSVNFRATNSRLHVITEVLCSESLTQDSVVTRALMLKWLYYNLATTMLKYKLVNSETMTTGDEYSLTFELYGYFYKAIKECYIFISQHIEDFSGSGDLDKVGNSYFDLTLMLPQHNVLMCRDYSCRILALLYDALKRQKDKWLHRVYKHVYNTILQLSGDILDELKQLDAVSYITLAVDLRSLAHMINCTSIFSGMKDDIIMHVLNIYTTKIKPTFHGLADQVSKSKELVEWATTREFSNDNLKKINHILRDTVPSITATVELVKVLTCYLLEIIGTKDITNEEILEASNIVTVYISNILNDVIDVYETTFESDQLALQLVLSLCAGRIASYLLVIISDPSSELGFDIKTIAAIGRCALLFMNKPLAQEGGRNTCPLDLAARKNKYLSAFVRTIYTNYITTFMKLLIGVDSTIALLSYTKKTSFCGLRKIQGRINPPGCVPTKYSTLLSLIRTDNPQIQAIHVKVMEAFVSKWAGQESTQQTRLVYSPAYGLYSLIIIFTNCYAQDGVTPKVMRAIIAHCTTLYAQTYIRDQEEFNLAVGALKRCRGLMVKGLLKTSDEFVEDNEYLKEVRPYMNAVESVLLALLAVKSTRFDKEHLVELEGIVPYPKRFFTKIPEREKKLRSDYLKSVANHYAPSQTTKEHNENPQVTRPIMKD